MSKIAYDKKKFKDKTLTIIDQANSIIDEYMKHNIALTLRQLYYQFVSRGYLDNTERSYDRLGDIISNARVAGYIDWDAIIDRNRNLEQSAHWNNPREMINACADQYRIDKWIDQTNRVEVWIEKDALIGVIEKICTENDVPYLACRGYVSQSEMWEAAQRITYRLENGQIPVIIYLGDHDPSGLDMVRDIKDRLLMFTRKDILVDRIALNIDQIKKYSLPPNPAKTTDSRYHVYQQKFGTKSWELDALDPRVIVNLIDEAIKQYRHADSWKMSLFQERMERDKLKEIAKTLGL